MPSSRPNLLLFMTDQQRVDSIGAFGSPFGHTPNIDASVPGCALQQRLRSAQRVLPEPHLDDDGLVSPRRRAPHPRQPAPAVGAQRAAHPQGVGLSRRLGGGPGRHVRRRCHRRVDRLVRLHGGARPRRGPGGACGGVPRGPSAPERLPGRKARGQRPRGLRRGRRPHRHRPARRGPARAVRARAHPVRSAPPVRHRGALVLADRPPECAPAAAALPGKPGFHDQLAIPRGPRPCRARRLGRDPGDLPRHGGADRCAVRAGHGRSRPGRGCPSAP